MLQINIAETPLLRIISVSQKSTFKSKQWIRENRISYIYILF